MMRTVAGRVRPTRDRSCRQSHKAPMMFPREKAAPRQREHGGRGVEGEGSGQARERERGAHGHRAERPPGVVGRVRRLGREDETRLADDSRGEADERGGDERRPRRLILSEEEGIADETGERCEEHGGRYGHEENERDPLGQLGAEATERACVEESREPRQERGGERPAPIATGR